MRAGDFPFVMESKRRLRWILLSAAVVALALLVAAAVAAVAPEEHLLLGFLRTDSLAPGSHTLQIVARSRSGQQSVADIPFFLRGPAPPGGGGGSAGGGGGGTNTSESAEPEPSSKNLRTVRLPGLTAGRETTVTLTLKGNPAVREAEQRSTLKGSKYSSLRRRDGTERVIILASGNDEATIPMNLPTRDAHLVELRVKALRLGPVRGLVLVNGKPWKAFTTAATGDGAYVWLPVGILRTRPKTFTVRFVNDFFACTDAQRRAGAFEDCDRNLSLDKVRVTPVAR